MAEESASRGRWRLYAALFGMVLPVAITVTVSPLLNSVAMDVRHLAPSQIGAIRTAEILLNALLSLWLSTRLTTLHPRFLGLLGIALFLAGNVGGMVGDGLAGLAVARLFAGAGAACLGAASAAIYAQFKSPQRVSGAFVAPWTVGSVIAALVAGGAAKDHAQAGVFGVLVAAALVGGLFVALTPAGRAPAVHQPKALTIVDALRRPYVWGWGLLFFGSTAVWHFFATIGRSHGIDSEQVSQLIAIGSVTAGVLGAIAVLIRDRWVKWTMLAAVAVFGIACTLVPLSPSAVIYAGAYITQSIMYVFVTILAPTIGVRLDRTGATNTAAAGLQTLANAMAPLIAGVLVQTGSFLPIGAMCAMSGALGLGFLFAASRTLPPLQPVEGASAAAE